MLLLNRIFKGLLSTLVCTLALVLVITIFLWGTKTRADTANLYLTLTILTPPECTIDGGNSMEVNFGDVHETLIDGSNYKRMPINYNLNCTSLAKNTLKMTLSWGNSTIGGGAAVQTERTNLGLAIYRDTTRLNNNTTLNFTYGVNEPSLYAVPVKPAGTTLTDGGPFNGNMTMIIDYQ